jgi:hypothetical protein
MENGVDGAGASPSVAPQADVAAAMDVDVPAAADVKERDVAADAGVPRKAVDPPSPHEGGGGGAAASDAADVRAAPATNGIAATNGVAGDGAKSKPTKAEKPRAPASDDESDDGPGDHNNIKCSVCAVRSSSMLSLVRCCFLHYRLCCPSCVTPRPPRCRAVSLVTASRRAAML